MSIVSLDIIPSMIKKVIVSLGIYRVSVKMLTCFRLFGVVAFSFGFNDACKICTSQAI